MTLQQRLTHVRVAISEITKAGTGHPSIHAFCHDAINDLCLAKKHLEEEIKTMRGKQK